ncbi:major facilitator superfamily member protein [Babesia ovata]|uniref:Major facilitator superfamily member protein n=1 Tax=Babesia ovata TaxID=189622 RepID=A0A2H6KB13_9APIC|nr:major facilitator superfamily member protein [Babesia ovata]GBE60184.1 major facilitator superfamily member protein [Babesia ovata]
MSHGSAGAADTASTENETVKSDYDTLGQALYNLVSFIEGYDQQVLSMCMRAFELTLGFSQSQLSTLATVSTMSRMGCCLIWGLLADKHESNYVLGAGLLVMGMASIVLSSASQYRSILFLRFLHGFGFASVYPAQQKIVSDSHVSSKVSGVFTTLQALNCIGRLLCAVITTIIARKVLLGYYGWRTSYVVLGYVWILFGIGIVFGMKSTPHKEGDKTPGAVSQVQQDGDANSADSKNTLTDLIATAFTEVFTSRTAWISIFTIFIAEAPMCAFNYMTIYLQYLGVSDTMAGVAIGITLIGGAAGSGAGGKIIDKLASLWKGYAEPTSGAIVMIIRYVVCLLFFLGPAPNGRLLWYHYVELAILGSTLVTLGGVDRPVMKNAIERDHQATASAIIRCISGIASSVIFFQISAYLTEKVFGYVPSRESFETMAAEVKEKNAEALRKSMMYIILAGTTLNLVCYAALFFTYREDMDKIEKLNAEKQNKKKAEKP